LVKEVFDVSGLKAHSIVLRPGNPDKITPHCLFLSYQPEPGAKMLDPEVYPRPTGAPLLPLSSIILVNCSHACVCTNFLLFVFEQGKCTSVE
jgi:hypothetical protein